MNAVSLARILIVDDEAANLRALCDTLRDKGYETEGAASGEDALRALNAQPFDLLLTDLMMPGIDGVELLTAAFKIDPQLVGILMTGQGTVETAVSAMQAGALDYVLKPIRLKDILPVLARSLGVRRLRQENLELRNTVAIHELNQAIAHTLDPNVLLDKIADAALAQFDADEVSIMLVTADGESLQIVAVRGAGREGLLGVRVPMGQAIAGRVAVQREPMVLGNTIADAGPAPSYPRSDIRSALSMPMITRGRLVGVINVNSVRRTGAFPLGQIKILSIFTNAAAASIESARLSHEQFLSESRYRLLIASVKDYSIVMLDPQGRVATWNEGARVMTGYEEAEVLGQPHGIFYVQEEVAAAGEPERLLEQAATDGRAEVEGWRVRKDGSHFYACVVLTAMRDAAGQITGFSKITRDVTESMTAQRKLAEQQAFLRQVIDLDRNFIFARDREGRFVLVNQAAAEVYGTSVENLLGKTDRDFNPNLDEVELVLRDDLDVMDNLKEKIIPEEKVIDADGRQRWVQTVKRAIERADGTSDMILGVSTDITARKEAEHRLREQMQRAEALLEAAPDAVVIVTSAGRISIVNARTEAMFGYSRVELLGQPVELLVPQQLHGGHRAQRDGYQQKPTLRAMGADRELFGRRKDGSEFAVDVSLSPLVTQEDTFIITAVRDVSERKRVEREIRELNASLEDRVAQRTRQLESASRAKDSFLATMSHEIRTPLGGLMGMLEVLSLSPLSGEQSETLHAARDSGRSLLRILNDILDWSKIEEGKLELTFQATSITGLLAGVANTYAHVASGNSITIAWHVDARLSPAFMVDELRLSQVLNNFVSNAIKFSHRGGRVELTAERVGAQGGAEEIRFSVKDTGIGIDAQVQQRLFQNYGQASADTARMYGGTGLGLAICRRLVDLMGGRIELSSEPGLGSTFSITLELEPTKIDAKPAGGRDASAAVTHIRALIDGAVAADAPLILVVDDHDINRKLLARQLALLGLRCETASDGQVALPLWRNGHYDLMITDCHMPKIDGYELTHTIRAIEAEEGRARTPIFAWTANALADEADRCHAAGMDELLVKPAELVQLKQLLGKWLPIDVDVAPAPQAATVSALDVSVLEGLVGDDPDVIRDFLRDFRASATAIGTQLAVANAAGDMSEVGDLAHKLKSSSRSVGALALSERCAELEASAATQDRAALAVLLRRFEHQLAAVQAGLVAVLDENMGDR